jgi:hypothetical protein
MKNLHLIITDKPSKLHEFGNIWFNHKEPKECFRNYNIYITSNEEIKECEYNVPSDFSKISDISKTSKEDLQVVNEKNNGYKKIILTTDPDLIKDGVQPISDEFLEWFVDNNSCETVLVTKEDEDLIPYGNQYINLSKIYSASIKSNFLPQNSKSAHPPKLVKCCKTNLIFETKYRDDLYPGYYDCKPYKLKYEIIIPTEESKQLFYKGDRVLFTGKMLNEEVIDKVVTVIYTLGRGGAEDMSDIMDEYTHVYRVLNKDLKHIPTEETKDFLGRTTFDLLKQEAIEEEMTEFDKQLSLEKVAKSEAFEFKVDYKPFETNLDYREYAEYGFEKGFIAGVNHKEKTSYSEEEVKFIISQALQSALVTVDLNQWFNQFKKK